MSELKPEIVEGCQEVLLPKYATGPIYLAPREEGREDSLILGTYEVMVDLIPKIRVNEELQEMFKEMKVRLGTRDEDRSPLLGKQEKLPERESNPEILFNLVMKLQEKWGHARDGDINPKVKAAFATKSLQAHHLVEDGIVKRLGRDTGSMTREKAPAVLIVQELHLRYLTPTIKPEDRERFTKQMKSEEAAQLIEKLFLGEKQKDGTRTGGLYTRPGLESLIKPTEAIIREVERTKPKP
jgi:hypothetical protein